MSKVLIKKEIKRILIIKIAAIGDLLLITPAVRGIRKKFPNARISLLVGKWSSTIASGNSNYDEIIAVEDSIFFCFRPFTLVALLLKLRAKKFDLVFVWHRSLAFRFFACLLGIKTRVGFSRNDHGRFLTHFVEEDPNLHEIFEYQATLKPLGIESNEIKMDFHIDEQDKLYVDNIWKSNNLEGLGPVVTIAPGGGKNPKEVVPLKHWPAEKYAGLADMLIDELGARIIFIGGEDDKLVVGKALSNMKGVGINLSGKTTLKQLAAIIKKSNTFIGNDSAPMHISAAVGTPTISIFGPTNPKELAPLNYKHAFFYEPPPCSPCYKNGKYPACKHKSCMDNISPIEVFKTVKDILESKNA